MSKQTPTSTIKDTNTQTLGTILILQQRDPLNSSMQTRLTTGSNSLGEKTLGKPIKEAYTTDCSSAGGEKQISSTQITNFTLKRPASLLLSKQLPQHFSNFLPDPTPQIIQLQWQDNRKKLMSLLAKPSKMRRGLTSLLIPLTAPSKETLHLCLMETGPRPASFY